MNKTDYGVKATEKQIKQIQKMHNILFTEHDEEQGQFNIIPDSYLPLDCDGKFREQDCKYCIEYEECKERGNNGR